MNKVEAGSHFHKSSSFNRNLTFSYFSENVKFKTWIKNQNISYLCIYRAPKILGIQNVWYLCKIIGQYIFLKVSQSGFQDAA